MKLIPIKETIEENQEFNNPLHKEILEMTVDFYKRIGFVPPWICYFVELNGEIVGSAGIKGKPVDGKIEIAAMEAFRHQGIATKICRELVQLSLKTDPTITITARTLPENNVSAKVLKKNNFACTRMVNDPEDGDVWEWEYQKK